MEAPLISLKGMARIKPIIVSSSIGLIVLAIVISSLKENSSRATSSPEINDVREIASSESSKIGTLIKSKKNNLKSPTGDQLLEDFGFVKPSRDKLENHIIKEGSINSLIATGIILQDPSYYYRALNIEPNNPHLLLLLGSHENIPPLQKLEFAEKLIKEQPENLVGSYLLASIQINQDQTNEAIATLLNTHNQNDFNDFLMDSSLAINETLILLENSEIGSALYSIFFIQSPMTYRYNEISNFLVNEFNDTQPIETLELRKITAELGTNMVSQKNFLINDLVGLAIQKKSMAGMEQNSPSPFIGLSVDEAHENLIKQKNQIKNLVVPDLKQMKEIDHDTLVEWFRKIREVGEYQATVWLNNES